MQSNANYDTKYVKKINDIEQKDVIQKALDELPDKQKDVIILKYYEDFKIKEIAKMLAEKVPTIKSRLKQGIEKLSKYLRKEDFYE